MLTDRAIPGVVRRVDLTVQKAAVAFEGPASASSRRRRLKRPEVLGWAVGQAALKVPVKGPCRRPPPAPDAPVP